MRFSTEEQAKKIGSQFGTPTYVYSEAVLRQAVQALLTFPNAFGLIVRFAMKACPNRAILQLLNNWGLHIDASSGNEVERAMLAGIPPDHIQLTSQELPPNLPDLVHKGIRFIACSLHQLEVYGSQFGSFPWREISIRVNPGLGSGHCSRCNTGGAGSSFGIWHKQLDEAKRIARKYGLKIVRLHTHVGSGSDPEVWVKVAGMSLAIAEQLPDVTVLNLGGGYKVGRVEGEKTTDLQVCGRTVQTAFEEFAETTGRKLQLEIEPGTYVVAAAGSIVASVIDVVTTKPDPDGQDFIKVDSGMTENLRPSLYGAQHFLTIVPRFPIGDRATGKYVVVGHCCESGDILTPAPGNSEAITTRQLTEAKIGDLVVIDHAGAYCEGMPGAGYNSYPAAASVLIRDNGTFQLIRQRQTLEQLIGNELGLNE